MRCIDSKANMNNAGGWWRQNSHFWIKVKSLCRGQPRTVIKFNSIPGKFQHLGFWSLKQSPLFTPILPIPRLAEGLLTNQSSNAHHYLKWKTLQALVIFLWTPTRDVFPRVDFMQVDITTFRKQNVNTNGMVFIFWMFIQNNNVYL